MMFIKKSVLIAGLAAMPFAFTGCDQAKEAAKGALSGEALTAAKDKLTATIKEWMPKIEEKIKGLDGEKKTEAQGLFDGLKTKFDGLKDIGGDKFTEYSATIMKLIEELKKKVGL